MGAGGLGRMGEWARRAERVENLSLHFQLQLQPECSPSCGIVSLAVALRRGGVAVSSGCVRVCVTACVGAADCAGTCGTSECQQQHLVFLGRKHGCVSLEVTKWCTNKDHYQSL